MKKNKMMRIASVLLIVTILSTCAISGTFAKYVVSGEGAGAARVAKWGINIAMTGTDLFSNEYDYTNPADVHYARAFDLAVKADDLVVAPGTSSDEVDGNFAAVISGTPEVAVRYALGFDPQATQDIVLTQGEVIKDETGLAESYDATTGEFTYPDYPVPAEYSPVKFVIHFNGKIAGRDFNFDFPAMSLTDFANMIDADTVSTLLGPNGYNGVKPWTDGEFIYFDCPAGKSIEGTFSVSWAWDFDNNGAGTYDIEDTYLGNHAEDYPISFAFVASATQID